jgi:hypothetical protein
MPEPDCWSVVFRGACECIAKFDSQQGVELLGCVLLLVGLQGVARTVPKIVHVAGEEADYWSAVKRIARGTAKAVTLTVVIHFVLKSIYQTNPRSGVGVLTLVSFAVTFFIAHQRDIVDRGTMNLSESQSPGHDNGKEARACARPRKGDLSGGCETGPAVGSAAIRWRPGQRLRLRGGGAVVGGGSGSPSKG